MEGLIKVSKESSRSGALKERQPLPLKRTCASYTRRLWRHNLLEVGDRYMERWTGEDGVLSRRFDPREKLL